MKRIFTYESIYSIWTGVTHLPAKVLRLQLHAILNNPSGLDVTHYSHFQTLKINASIIVSVQTSLQLESISFYIVSAVIILFIRVSQTIATHSGFSSQTRFMAFCGSDGKAVAIRLRSLPTIIYINGYFAYNIVATFTARVRICLRKIKRLKFKHLTSFEESVQISQTIFVSDKSNSSPTLQKCIFFLSVFCRFPVQISQRFKSRNIALR